MVCGTTTCRMARNPSRVVVKRSEVVGLQGEASFTLHLSDFGCFASPSDTKFGSISVGPGPKSSPFRRFQGRNAHFQGRRRRNFHTRPIRKSLCGFSKISRHANRNKITVSFQRLPIRRFGGRFFLMPSLAEAYCIFGLIFPSSGFLGGNNIGPRFSRRIRDFG